MIIILNNIFPVFAIIALGYGLKKYHLCNDGFLKKSDTLIYYVFFPAMLFLKTGAPAPSVSIEWKLTFAVGSAVLTIYAVSLAFMKVTRLPDYLVGSFSQCCYRFNTYIGMAVLLTALNEGGMREFAVMIGFVIPFINVLAVSTLIWYSGLSYRFSQKIGILTKSILTNPLILACMAGILFSELNFRLPVFIRNTLHLLSLISLPMALISIGGSLNFSRLKGQIGNAMLATLFKLFMLPVTGYFFLRFFGVSSVSMQVGMIFFALPTSTASYILSSQLHSDVNLASAAIILSTLLSFISLSLVLALFVG